MEAGEHWRGSRQGVTVTKVSTTCAMDFFVLIGYPFLGASQHYIIPIGHIHASLQFADRVHHIRPSHTALAGVSLSGIGAEVTHTPIASAVCSVRHCSGILGVRFAIIARLQRDSSVGRGHCQRPQLQAALLLLIFIVIRVLRAIQLIAHVQTADTVSAWFTGASAQCYTHFAPVIEQFWASIIEREGWWSVSTPGCSCAHVFMTPVSFTRGITIRVFFGALSASDSSNIFLTSGVHYYFVVTVVTLTYTQNVIREVIVLASVMYS